MIRVNLLRNLGTSAAPNLSVASDGPMVSQDLQKQAGLRLMVIISFVGLIIAYEKMQLSAKEQVIAQVRTEINQTRATKDKFGDAAPIVEKYEAEKKKLDSTIRVLEGLTENRLREVKLLDAVQSLTPARGWLEEIKVENGKASLIGYAPDEATVNALFRALEGNVLFSNVKVKSEAREVPNAGLVHRFEFTFNAGRVR